MQSLTPFERARRLAPRAAARVAFEKGLADGGEVKILMEALEQERQMKEKAYRIAREEGEVARLQTALAKAEVELAEENEKMALAAHAWYIENNVTELTPSQKEKLSFHLYLHESIIETKTLDIQMLKGELRDATRHLHMSKGIPPSPEELAQQEREKEAERYFSKVSRLSAMPQYVRDDIYESSEYHEDLVAFWTEQSERCERIIAQREKAEKERYEAFVASKEAKA
jgi:hypothetical protein